MRPRSTVLSRNISRGFTLLEVLAATMMFATAVGAVYAVFHGAVSLREKAHASFETGLPRRYVAEVLRKDLKGIVVPAGVLAGPMIGEPNEEGQVRRDRLEFRTTSGIVDAAAPWGDVQLVEYFMSDDEERNDSTAADAISLIRSVTRNLLEETEENADEETILTGVRSLTFGYYDGEEWLDSWDSTARDNELPQAVRVVVEFDRVGTKDDSEAKDVLEIITPIFVSEASSGAEGGIR